MKNQILKIVLGAIVSFIIINNFIFSPGNILSWDVFGYYLYLPLKFIFHDLAITNEAIIQGIIAKYHNTATFYQALLLPDGNYVMKYPMGLSIIYSPFFFIGHLMAKIFNYPADGFSAPYQCSIFIAGIIYSLIGILIMSKVLLRFFKENISAYVLIIIVTSTNYLVHLTMYGQNAMSHNYLFTAYALILYLTILWHESFKIKYAVFLAITCGMTILIRPSEIVCLIIPVLWVVKSFPSAIEKIKLLLKSKYQVIIFVLILLVIGSFQFIYWKLHTGKFLFNSYGGNPGEGFEFKSPYIWEVLLSFRKGWLIYTPIMVFSIIGFYFIYIKNRSIFYALFVYFIINIYIVSSWSCWWYAQTFSQRALIPSYPILAIGLGYFLTWLVQQNKYLKGIIFGLMIGCGLLNIFQTYQFHYGIIDGDRMTKEYYFKVFGKMHATEEDKKLLLIKRSFDGTEIFNNEDEYRSKFLKKLDFEVSEKKDSTEHYSGKYSFKLDSLTIYTPSIESPYYEITNKDHAWIKVTAYVYPTKDIVNDPFCLAVHFNHHGYAYKYYTYNSEKMKLELNKWNKIIFNYLTPEVRKKSDSLKVYLWNRGKTTIFVDDLQVDIYEKK